MKHYVVAEVNVTDDSWVPSYLENVTKLVEAGGGKYLARTPNFEKIEGVREGPQIFVIIEFPSKNAATSFYESAEYLPHLRARQKGGDTELVLVPGEDIANA